MALGLTLWWRSCHSAGMILTHPSFQSEFFKNSNRKIRWLQLNSIWYLYVINIYLYEQPRYVALGWTLWWRLCHSAGMVLTHPSFPGEWYERACPSGLFWRKLCRTPRTLKGSSINDVIIFQGEWVKNQGNLIKNWLGILKSNNFNFSSLKLHIYIL